jgi:hypothetical protein
MYDLTLNDENIFTDNQTIVRKYFGEEEEIIKKLFEIL